ncbi:MULTISPECIES: hypothetical protein [unclassified Sphingomonas]|uniref:hypothetical protein n=1 Tax=unclassified Sphingomonas TaxID=196159 RepID=UPI0006F20F10|nr:MULTISPECIES: hypothetical protein [unclassified Sphingomonas]KQM66812.1 hypothetical protein ASE65_01660 [Sphingomonas sp. Leaf16]KQN17760.1 hypothetical protein ASE81_01040 [Sphingomonas sp. Leaf29]KQN23622.1 hypothetical protein ASE83_03920 [Sphingomonas sp. Leaf32]
MISGRVLSLLVVGGFALGSCSANIETADCATRFAEIGQRFSALTSTIDASYVFDAGDRGKNPEFVKASGALDVVVGDGRQRIADFERRDFQKRPTILMAEGKTFVGVGATAKSSTVAVRQGCSLEPRYGTLRTIRLTSVNPTMSASATATTTSTKNER